MIEEKRENRGEQPEDQVNIQEILFRYLIKTAIILIYSPMERKCFEHCSPKNYVNVFTINGCSHLTLPDCTVR